jgi:uncharacterized protein DUF5658
MRIVHLPPVVRASVILAACVAAASPAVAQQQPKPPSAITEATEVAPLWLAAQMPPRTALFPVNRVEEPKRPASLLPLYGSLIALQGLDIHSTRGAVGSGEGREANPAMEPIVKNSAAFIAVKAGATAGVIWASEKMWKKHRKASVLFASAVNIAMAAIVANNYRVSR